MTELPHIPNYRIVTQLAEGGMGIVYRAEDETLGREVAVKMIRAALLASGEDGEESLARFLREARAAAQIRSNHVAHVLQFGKTDTEDLYIVLEFLDGVTLDALLKRLHRVPPARAVHIARQICRGLGAAHNLSIVHRDLKPSNVMLIEQDGDPDFVKILDFGVAKVVGEVESGVTKAGMLVGTYACMAPEQILGDTIDARTDVYALGVLMYRMLVGRSPFRGADATAMLYHHVHTNPTPLSAAASDAGIPSSLDQIVIRCLAKNPLDRFASMEALDAALAEVEKAGFAPGAEPDPALYSEPTKVNEPPSSFAVSVGSPDEIATQLLETGDALRASISQKNAVVAQSPPSDLSGARVVEIDLELSGQRGVPPAADSVELTPVTSSAAPSPGSAMGAALRQPAASPAAASRRAWGGVAAISIALVVALIVLGGLAREVLNRERAPIAGGAASADPRAGRAGAEASTERSAGSGLVESKTKPAADTSRTDPDALTPDAASIRSEDEGVDPSGEAPVRPEQPAGPRAVVQKAKDAQRSDAVEGAQAGTASGRKASARGRKDQRAGSSSKRSQTSESAASEDDSAVKKSTGKTPDPANPVRWKKPVFGNTDIDSTNAKASTNSSEGRSQNSTKPSFIRVRTGNSGGGGKEP